MRIAITSGKGGTGKTTVSTCLFNVLSMYSGHTCQLVDCDVEEPDCSIFIQANLTATHPVRMYVPVINMEACTMCGKCKNACAFNAIVLLPPTGFIEIVEDMCHGCGACSYVCPHAALSEVARDIGMISNYDSCDVRDAFIEGRMNVGSSLQTRVIRETIRHAHQKDFILFDAPPGTSCPVIATISPADYVIMVTEPTPFGLHDLKLMTETVRQLNKKYGIVINKAGLNYQPLYDFIEGHGIPLLGEIPFKKEYAAAYSKGMILVDYDPELKELFKKMIYAITEGKKSF